MADVSVKREAEEDVAAEDTTDAMAAADLQTTPAQAAGRRTRKPVQPLGGVVTRRTSARQVASSASRGSAATESSNSTPRQSGRATRQAGPRTRATPAAAAEGDAPAGTTPQRASGRGTWKRKKSDAEELSTSEPEMEHDDSDSDPVWVPDATASSKGATGADADSPTAANDSTEPVAKVARRGKPAKATKAKAGARKGAATAGKKPNGASKSEAGAGGGAAKGGRRGTARKTEPVPSIDLGSSVASPDSLQLKVELPGDSEEVGITGGVKRDYTRRPVTNASAWRTPVPVVVTEPGAASTGELQPGDYIIAVADVHRARPPIWRIEGRSLLQRFEALETGEDTLLYRNSSSFSAWNPLEQSKYANISVRVHSNSRSATVVEVLEIHANPNSSLAKNGGTEARSAACGDQQPNLEEKFEVYLQTLLSHVLDPNFLAEVHRENDEYFLANLQTVDGENERRGSQIRQPLWGPELWLVITTRPDVRVTDLRPTQATAAVNIETENSAGGNEVIVIKKEPVDETLCEACGKDVASRLAEFSGGPYDMLDLSLEPRCDDKPWACSFQLCASCADPLPTFSELYHYKYHTFHRCREKIERLKQEQNVTESHIILERCLQDDTWVNQMYSNLQKLWRTCTLGSS
ncbi:uncharacterized protein LOC119383774 isoform X2 [Rhipicephalus sanguineus]|uniref:uncharacterized protein LOC119383774 isoform X2 n=1 Tax=Rhipicephalus sanguineus TaxID=34632 RepID=UPI0020C2C038|nr:uncharacterized protein LOC119383774 isoform X2 [Rhipicephalus sanguineus]